MFFEPPGSRSGSGSISKRYGSVIRILLSASKNSKKNLDSYCFVTSFGLFFITFANGENMRISLNNNMSTETREGKKTNAMSCFFLPQIVAKIMRKFFAKASLLPWLEERAEEEGECQVQLTPVASLCERVRLAATRFSFSC
jgi:hypothetical protein